MQLLMRRSSLDHLPALPKLTDKFLLRPMTTDDLSDVAALLCAAFEDASWTRERAQKEFSDHPDVVETWLITTGENIIATASTLFKAEIDPDTGWVHWAATDPAYRGQSLGYLVSLRVLHDFVQLGCKTAALRTDAFRLAAIKTYLKLGFVPVAQEGEQPAIWDEILTRLKYQRAD